MILGFFCDGQAHLGLFTAFWVNLVASRIMIFSHMHLFTFLLSLSSSPCSLRPSTHTAQQCCWCQCGLAAFAHEGDHYTIPGDQRGHVAAVAWLVREARTAWPQTAGPTGSKWGEAVTGWIMVTKECSTCCVQENMLSRLFTAFHTDFWRGGGGHASQQGLQMLSTMGNESKKKKEKEKELCNSLFIKIVAT